MLQGKELGVFRFKILTHPSLSGQTHTHTMFAPALLGNTAKIITASVTLRLSLILHSTVQARGQLSLSLKYRLQFLSL